MLLERAHQATAAPVRMLPTKPEREKRTETPERATIGRRQYPSTDTTQVKLTPATEGKINQYNEGIGLQTVPT